MQAALAMKRIVNPLLRSTDCKSAPAAANVYIPRSRSSTEGVCVWYGWNNERKDRHSSIQPVPELEATPLLGQSFLVQGLLCWYSRSRRRDDNSVCEVPRRERKKRRKEIINQSGENPGQRHSYHFKGWTQSPFLWMGIFYLYLALSMNKVQLKPNITFQNDLHTCPYKLFSGHSCMNGFKSLNPILKAIYDKIRHVCH